MNEDPVTLVEAAATRVRDPVTGRSVWLAKMVQDARFEEGVLSMTLSFQAQHGADDQSGIEAALCANLTALGFDGTVDIKRRVATPAPARAPECTGHGQAGRHPTTRWADRDQANRWRQACDCGGQR